MILEKLFYTPIVSVKDIQTEFDTTYQSASNIISKFEAAGILKDIASLLVFTGKPEESLELFHLVQ